MERQAFSVKGSITKRLVVVPVYNEEKYIRRVLKKIREYHKGDILVINDGSTDRSAEFVDQFDAIKSITHLRNIGYGRSITDGFNYALENGYERLVTMDCDEQHQPHHIPEIFRRLEEVDVYSGSRYLQKMESDDAPPADRYRINMMITEKINQLTDYGLTDSFCGMKGYRVKALQPMRLREDGYGFPIEFWMQARHFGLNVKEFPTERIYKNMGRSFGKELDNPQIRLDYYNKLLEREARRWFLCPRQSYSRCAC